MQETKVSNRRLRLLAKYEELFNQFLHSPDFQEALINYACHTRQWHYENQTLKVELLYRGTWEVPSDHSYSENSSCIVTLGQVSTHQHFMELLGDSRDFDSILEQNPNEARAIVEKLYIQQESLVKDRSVSQFRYLKSRGYLD